MREGKNQRGGRKEKRSQRSRFHDDDVSLSSHLSNDDNDEFMQSVNVVKVKNGFNHIGDAHHSQNRPSRYLQEGGVECDEREVNIGGRSLNFTHSRFQTVSKHHNRSLRNGSVGGSVNGSINSRVLKINKQRFLNRAFGNEGDSGSANDSNICGATYALLPPFSSKMFVPFVLFWMIFTEIRYARNVTSNVINDIGTRTNNEIGSENKLSNGGTANTYIDPGNSNVSHIVTDTIKTGSSVLQDDNSYVVSIKERHNDLTKNENSIDRDQEKALYHANENVVEKQEVVPSSVTFIESDDGILGSDGLVETSLEDILADNKINEISYERSQEKEIITTNRDGIGETASTLNPEVFSQVSTKEKLERTKIDFRQDSESHELGNSEADHFNFPKSFHNLADFTTLRDESDIPVFWHVPKAGGSTMKTIFGKCLKFTMANEVGKRNKVGNASVEIVHINGADYVNVDTTTPRGIEMAKSLRLIESGLAEIVFSSFLYKASSLFTEENHGRLFTVLRHPVDRAVSMFRYLQYADWEPTYSPHFVNMTIEEYARTRAVENNWMTRFLSDTISGTITEEHLEKAKKVLRDKFLIGLLEYKEESWSRIISYFGIDLNKETDPIKWECVHKFLKTGANKSKSRLGKLTEESEAYSILLLNNNLDVKLYDYAKVLFKYQGTLLESV